MDIRSKIFNTKISRLQLDPFGFCNSKCWYCPVAYVGNPESGKRVMSINEMRYLFEQIKSESEKEDSIFEKGFKHVRTTHFNEILLYPHFEEMLELLREFGFWANVMSNGVNLTPEKTDLIEKYQDVIVYIGLNIPAYEKSLWAKRTGFLEKRFDELIDNVHYASNKLINFLPQGRLHLHIDGVRPEVVGDEIELGPKFFEIGYDVSSEHEQQYQLAKTLFPKLAATKFDITDRQGMLADYIDNQQFYSRKYSGKKFSKCNAIGGDRSLEWMNINSNGDLFLCCHDYNFDYIFGNIFEDSLRNLWFSEKRIEVLSSAFDDFCLKCLFAEVE